MSSSGDSGFLIHGECCITRSLHLLAIVTVGTKLKTSVPTSTVFSSSQFNSFSALPLRPSKA